MLCDNCPSVEPEPSSELLSRELLAHVRRVAHSTVASPPQWLPNGCWPRRGSSHAHAVVRRSVVRHAHGREGSVHAQQRVHGQALQPIDDALARLQLLWTPAAASAAALQWRQEDEKPTTGRERAVWPFGHLAIWSAHDSRLVGPTTWFGRTGTNHLAIRANGIYLFGQMGSFPRRQA